MNYESDFARSRSSNTNFVRSRAVYLFIKLMSFDENIKRTFEVIKSKVSTAARFEFFEYVASPIAFTFQDIFFCKPNHLPYCAFA